MATLEAVVSELKELNDYTDLTLDAQFEISDRVGELSGRMQELTSVMLAFMNTVPESLSRGFEELIQSDERLADKQKKDADTRERLRQREGGDDGDDEGKSRTEKLKGSFKKGFEQGKEEDLFGGIFKTLDDIVNTAGLWSGKVVKVLGILKTGFLSLGSMLISGVTAVAGFVTTTLIPAMTALFSSLSAMLAPVVAALAPLLVPIALIAAAITGIVSGIMSFIDDFKSTEGTLLDKIMAGILGFVDGFMKLITVPLDMLKSFVSTILEFIGFEGAAAWLDSFSFTEMFDELTDQFFEFWKGIKDWIGEKLAKLNPFNWFGDDEAEDIEVPPDDAKRGGPEDLEGANFGEDVPSDPLAAQPVKLSQDAQERLAEFKGTGVPEYNPETRRRGGVIGKASAAPSKINTRTGKRGMVIGDRPVTPSKVATVNVTPTVSNAEIDVSADLDKIQDSASELFTPVVEAVDKVKGFFSDLIDFSAIQQTMSNLFAEIGIPRVEFDVPFMGKVGFGPFYPFRPGEDTTQIASKTEVVTESSGDDYKKTFKDNASGIEDDSVFSYAKENVDEQVKNELGQTENISTQTGVTASFDDMTGKGRVTFDTYKTVDNLVTDEFKELQNTVERFEVGPIVMGKVRRMIDAGATPDQVKEFLRENEKSISEKITNFFAPAGEAAGDMLGKVGSFFGIGEEESQLQMAEAVAGTGQESAMRSNVLSMERQKMDATQAQQAEAASNVVVAPSDNRTSVSNTTVNSVPIPSPMDKSDRTSRGAYRGRKI